MRAYRNVVAEEARSQFDQYRCYGDQDRGVYLVLVVNVVRYKYDHFRGGQEHCACIIPAVKALGLNKRGSLRGDQQSCL